MVLDKSVRMGDASHIELSPRFRAMRLHPNDGHDMDGTRQSISPKNEKKIGLVFQFDLTN